MHILLTGGSGQAGGELQKTLAPFGRIVAPTRNELDLANEASIIKVVRDLSPDLIVNAGAYTAVDKAEEERELCQAINTVAPALLAEEAKKIGAPLIHYSTDYVFDGRATEPYTETDQTHPLGVYGATKLAGENFIIATGAFHFIFRTCGLYSPGARNFPNTMLRLAAEREELTVVDDQIIGPTSAIALAEGTARIVGALVVGGQIDADRLSGLSGLYNMVCSGETTWFGFAKEVIEQAKARGAVGLNAKLTPIPASDYPTPARRPAYSLLSSEKLSKAFGPLLPEWETEVIRFISDSYPSG